MTVEEAKEKECCQLEGRCQADKGGLVMEELRKCPFCGGEAVIKHGIISDDNIYVACVECDSCSGILHEEGEAIAAWNRRVEG